MKWMLKVLQENQETPESLFNKEFPFRWDGDLIRSGMRCTSERVPFFVHSP